jgi:hypothetical protein
MVETIAEFLALSAQLVADKLDFQAVVFQK